jgi:glycosyltransferase involved in cell wall biosynthesis
MNILFFTDNFPPEVNAAASRVFERACYWVKQGHQVTVITGAPNFPEGKVFPGYKNKWYQEETIQAIKVIRVKTFIAKNEGIILRALDFFSYMIMSALTAAFIKKPDIVVVTSPQFFAAIGAWFTAKCKRVPFVLELSDLWPESISIVGVMKKNIALRFLEKIELFLYQKAAAIVTLTHAIRESLVKRNVPAGKIVTIINGVDLSYYSPRPRVAHLADQFGLQNKFIIGYIGTHGLAQGLSNILEAAKLLKEYPDICFIFVGKGVLREALIEQAKREHIDNVLFLSPQPKENMPNIWSLCDIALVHLKNDPFFKGAIPSKIFEAMGMGLPLLLAAPEGEASMIIEGNKVGMVVPPEAPSKLAAAIVNYKNNPTMLKEIAQKSYQAAHRYTRERQANDFLKVLDTVLQGKEAELTKLIQDL